jgi:E3 ubiquitin-protein ligase RNF14
LFCSLTSLLNFLNFFFFKKRHGSSTPCTIHNVRKIVKDYLEADEKSKVKFEIRYGKKNLDKLIRDVATELEAEKWVKLNAQNCPSCKAAIEKSMGCNHMICSRCHTHFCYLCGNTVNPSEPYKHFNDQKSSCNQMLFEGEFVEEEFDDDDI